MALVFKGTRRELVQRLNKLVRALSADAPDSGRFVRPILTRAAVALLTQIQVAFIIKSQGGIGLDGIKWPPLKPATIAARRATRDELKALGVGGRRVRGLLTPAQDREWRRIFARTAAMLRARGTPEGEILGIAARVAWSKLKQMGAKTRLELLGNRQVDILRDTGRLLRSLTPGLEDAPARPANQIFKVRPGEITVGTTVEYAETHQKGNPAKNVPPRPLWPDSGQLPAAWWDAINAAIVRGVEDAVRKIVTG